MTSPRQDFPRVLVVTQNKMQPFTGGGVILSVLFRDFPPQNLIFLHRDQEFNVTTPFEEHRLVWSWLRIDLRSLMRHMSQWFKSVMQRPRKLSAKDFVALIVASSYFLLPRKLDRRIRQLQPDIIYAWVGDSLWARTLATFAQRYQVPYVIHFMDNHFELVPSTSLDIARASQFRRQLSEVARHAAAIYAISDRMGRAYQSYWNRPYEVFRGTVDTSAWPWMEWHCDDTDETFRFGFAGSIDRSQMVALSLVAKALDTLRDQGHNVQLVLYLTDAYARTVSPVLSRFHCVAIRPHPDSAKLFEALASMHVLVLAYAFDEATIQYYRYSFATKIVPYMLSGRPILAYGPKEIEPIHYAARGGWAYVVSEPGEEALIGAIETLKYDKATRHRLARSAWEAGQREHDSSVQAARFARSLFRFGKREGQDDSAEAVWTYSKCDVEGK